MVPVAAPVSGDYVGAAVISTNDGSSVGVAVAALRPQET